MRDRFFTKLDWAAFWTATLITFVVYFVTLGPSVGLEDSGELATAAANRVRAAGDIPGVLAWALEHGAVVASRVYGDLISEVMGASNQLWLAGVPAKYFIRDIVSIDFLQLDEPPAPPV